MKKKKKRLNRIQGLSVIFLAIIIGSLLINLVYTMISNGISGKAVYETGIVTRENFASFLEQQQIIKDMPKSALISLKTFRIENGEWVTEDNYYIKGNEVNIGDIKNPDITLFINSNYIGESDLCNTIKKANSNGNLSYELHKEELGLLIKYYKLMKYEACFS